MSGTLDRDKSDEDGGLYKRSRVRRPIFYVVECMSGCCTKQRHHCLERIIRDLLTRLELLRGRNETLRGRWHEESIQSMTPYCRWHRAVVDHMSGRSGVLPDYCVEDAVVQRLIAHLRHRWNRVEA